MSTITDRREPRPGMTLERAVMLAMLLHLLAGSLVNWWPGMLQAPVTPLIDQKPLEFRFVDTPDTDEPPLPPDTDVLSDRDRIAADLSSRDDAATAYSEGNSPQAVLRSDAGAPPQPAVDPSAASTAERTPVTEADAETVVEETGETTEATAAEATPAESTAEAMPPVPPRDALRRSLAQLESFVDPMIHDNRGGGAADSKSLALFDTRGYDLGPYLRQVLRAIESNWRANMPPLLRTGAGGASFVALSIRRDRRSDGTERAVIIVQQTWTSGQPAYDTAALFSLEVSNPLPPIPQYYPYESIDGRLGFIYNLDPSSVVFPGER